MTPEEWQWQQVLTLLRDMGFTILSHSMATQTVCVKPTPLRP